LRVQEKIEHQQDRQRFIINLEGEPATLEYAWINDDRVDFRSTYVPEKQRRQGIGGRLVQEGLTWARRGDFTVVASCPFVKSYVDEHPEFKDLLE
jgi:uncharacterized protein